MKRLFPALLLFASVLHAQINLTRMLSGVNYVTSSTYTFVAADSTRVVSFSNGSNSAATLPNGATFGFTAGTMFSIYNAGGGTRTITCSGCTMNGSATLVLNATQGSDLYSDGLNYIAVVSLSGSANVSLSANNTFTGTNAFTNTTSFTNTANFSGLINVTNAGVFTNTQMNEYVSSAINGINFATEFNHTQGGNFATEGGAFGVQVTSGSVHQINGVAGYVLDSVNGNSGTGPNGVGGYFQCRLTVNGATCWGENDLLEDAVGLSGHWMLNESDSNIRGAPSLATYRYYSGQNSGTMPSGLAVGGPCTAGAAWLIFCPLNPWPTGLWTARGSITGAAFLANASCGSSAGACPSAAYGLVSQDSGNALHLIFIDAFHGVPSGNCNAGSLALDTNPADASHLLYVCFPANTWVAH